MSASYSGCESFRRSISFWKVLIRLDEREIILPLMLNPRNLNQWSAVKYSTFFGLSCMDFSDSRFREQFHRLFVVGADEKHIVRIAYIVAIHLREFFIEVIQEHICQPACDGTPLFERLVFPFEAVILVEIQVGMIVFSAARRLKRNGRTWLLPYRMPHR